MKRAICLFIGTAIILSIAGSAYCQNTAKDKKTAPAADTKASANASAAKNQAVQAATTTPRPRFTTLFGTVSKVDASDPNNVKLEMMNDADKKIHNVVVPPSATVVQVTDASGLKQGDIVRVMAQTVGEKDTALNVAFGKVKAPQAVAPTTKNAVPVFKSTSSSPFSTSKAGATKNSDVKKLLESAKKAQ